MMYLSGGDINADVFGMLAARLFSPPEGTENVLTVAGFRREGASQQLCIRSLNYDCSRLGDNYIT